MARRSSTASDNGTTKSDSDSTTDSTKKTTKKKTSRSRPSSSSRGRSSRPQSNAIESSSGAPDASRMIVNYIPGDECRIAFVEDGKLEEYHAEPTGTTSRVNNIYFGVVRNVNTAVQAAFVDFGLDEHGFLHTTDVHPRYFPKNEDAAERVGLKTPRRDRPPIQKCFKPGDRIMVQVLKEGVGTKGPTLTSYISIPGRYLVMMPGMDNVGVSRKVEDDDTRRAMRKVLDQLDLPEGFGFILRTAGMDRTKTELNRDLAYLKRLWADMDKRQKGKKAPLALYAESDLLLRALRDLAGTEVTDIIIDDPGALARAERFIKIASPRSRPQLRQYTGRAPIFAAFGIEQQIHNIHSREVPLPSGGRLIFDETEALVAIDVNSGRSRGARDAESNAFNTNMEAADEICRQLRLRDMGGLVINDLIDMRHASNRKAVAERFSERLKRDRAKSTILPISEFGLLEMTRQRMRSSHERTHFAECNLCKGRGVIRRPDSVAAEALRDLSLIASHDKVARVEMVVSAQVASHLLSGRRKQLSRIERVTGVITEVRVSENMAAERFVLHAYDTNNNDIDIDKLPKLPDPEQFLVEAEGLSDSESNLSESIDAHDEDHDDTHTVEAHPIELDADYDESEQEESEGTGRRRRRRRRGGRGRGGDSAQRDQEPVDTDEDAEHDDRREVHDPESEEESDRPRRRRRRRGGRGRRGGGDAQRDEVEASSEDDHDEQASADDHSEAHDGDSEEASDRPRRRRRRGGRGRNRSGSSTDSEDRRSDEQDDEGESDSLARRLGSALSTPVHTDDEDEDQDDDAQEDSDRPRRKRRRRGRGGRDRDEQPEVVEEPVAVADVDEEEDEEDNESPTVEVVAPEPAPSGVIEPRPKRGRKDDDEPKAEKKPRPRFLYAAHRKTKPGGPDGG
ncbi:MAG: Rne/Rng family ribonuclease [Phycisphaera sp.]|nr:MAG: Rne/Rng family ribonuclease [Phycisphaera sp.]